ncbi:hypothetical protein BMF94_2978 [Rhodotorula taiwanensis]|uniref:Uncharacterized protein n=1 Tax=Rhodotorula taiwanensis TaxID=741276 RepID=A0A2S5BAY3_9BASI|nr:hypothetical protein BMF94_2978 [Rhodotorula taiwanensis]
MLRRTLRVLASPGARPALAVSAPTVSPSLASKFNCSPLTETDIVDGAADSIKPAVSDLLSSGASESTLYGLDNSDAFDEEKAYGLEPLKDAANGSHAAVEERRVVQIPCGILPPRGRLDRWLDTVVHWSGSLGFFVFVTAGLVAWAALGIAGFGQNTDWNVLISDIQAIGTYILDSFLVRQQLAAHDDVLVLVGVLRSRSETVRALLRQIATQQTQAAPEGNGAGAQVDEVEIDVGLPDDTWIGKAAKRLSDVAGHLVTILIFWVGVGVWLAFGPSQGWSPQWQLYMNSSSSALMLFVFAFLCCVRERHGDYVGVCLDQIQRTDEKLERVLRTLTGDERPHPTIVIAAPQVTRMQRVINYYADFIGSLAGVGFLVVVLVGWAAIGPAFHFDDTWWLLSGTYAGLIGMNDGFVMRNTAAQFQLREGSELARLAEADALCEEVLPVSNVGRSPSTGTAECGTRARAWQRLRLFTLRASLGVGRLCSHEYAVLAGVLVIVGLVASATALRWSLTGQLLCNVPPSIIESWMMLMVIQGHNENDARTRADLAALLERRAVSLAHAQHLVKYGVTSEVRFVPVLRGATPASAATSLV